MKKFLAIMLILLLCGTALAEVAAPLVDEAYVEVEDFNLAMGMPIIETTITYANGALIFNYEFCSEPVDLYIDGKYIDKVGVRDFYPGSFDYKIELSSGKHEIKLIWGSYTQTTQSITVKGSATPKPTATQARGGEEGDAGQVRERQCGRDRSAFPEGLSRRCDDDLHLQERQGVHREGGQDRPGHRREGGFDQDHRHHGQQEEDRKSVV